MTEPSLSDVKISRIVSYACAHPGQNLLELLRINLQKEVYTNDEILERIARTRGVLLGEDLTDEWPEQILDELEPVLTPHWIDQHIITLGPRYGPDTTDSQIASDYLVGIRELIHQHRLEQTSLFVQRVTACLEKVTHGASSAPLAVNTKPQSESEIEIFTALHFHGELQ